MKKIFLALFVSFIFLGSFLFFSLSKAQAQTPTPANQILQIAGYNCGNAESTDVNVQKCCLSSNLLLKDKVDFKNWCKIPVLCSIPPISLFDNVTGYFASSWPLKDLNEWYTGVAKKVNPCISGNPSTFDYSDPSCVCKLQPATTMMLCDKYLKDSKDYGNCVSCSSSGVWTSIGCVKNNLNSFIGETVFGMGIGLGGGFSLLCIIYAAFMMQSSQGNPEKLKKAQEMITSCIMGLMLIIFSVFILKLIGVNILKIPGFS